MSARSMALLAGLLGTFPPVAVHADHLPECGPEDFKNMANEVVPMLDPPCGIKRAEWLEKPPPPPSPPPPDSRTLPELLCDEAGAVIAMAESVLRNEYPTSGSRLEHHDDTMI